MLCDYKEENVDAMRALADELNVDGAVVARRGDAFNRESLARIQPRATIGIVSGLYELIPSNESVLNSLRGVADAIEPGGYLIYTNQPWHPQLEFIAHVLVNREGERWIMRRRTTAEMDELVRAAGFREDRYGNRSVGNVHGFSRTPWTLNVARRSSSRSDCRSCF